MHIGHAQNLPPRLQTDEGMPRRVGVELEFAAVSARDCADLVKDLFGGAIAEIDPNRFKVDDTRFGTFVCELDSQYLHAKTPDGSDDTDTMWHQVKRGLQEIAGSVSALVVPCEIVCPPIAITDLPELNGLVSALQDAGAAGTTRNPLYAFGAQLNPEIASAKPDYLTSILKAYLLLSDWLRAVIDVDPTRRLAAYAKPFPDCYVRKVIDPDYWPNRTRLIDDYLTDNATRNRELDLLPLFAHLDSPRVRAAVNDPLIKPRPTFHYRLPDARFGEPGWTVLREWNRWCVVERLAENRTLLTELAAAHARSSAPKRWAVTASEWLILS